MYIVALNKETTSFVLQCVALTTLLDIFGQHYVLHLSWLILY